MNFTARVILILFLVSPGSLSAQTSPIVPLPNVTRWAAARAPAAAPGWRIGFEWNENWPWSPAWGDPQIATLLSKLAAAAPGGAINVNGLSHWAALEPFENWPVDWGPTDEVVARLQSFGFEISWYLHSNARWAWVDPNTPAQLGASMAPAPEHEDDWQDLIRAAVERYDGDGVSDMPGLVKPIRYFILPGEVRFGQTGNGDAEPPVFWADTVEALLRLHRLTYEAVHQADPTGQTKVVSSGALLWDLYADFPDYPQFDPADPQSLIQRRLAGENLRSADYRAGWQFLKTMLASFGNDSDGIECDYVGWHPHYSWRVIDQEFALIRSLAGDLPIYVDDMWMNLFAVGYTANPGESQFAATATPSTGWVTALNGDFPNELFPASDPYGQLFNKLNANDAAAHAYYQAAGSHRLIQSIVSAFGEGAERVSFSGSNDTKYLGAFRGWELGWINLLNTFEEGYAEKPQYWALKALNGLIADFTAASRLPATADPRTRIYRFDRPRGPLYVAWSETGPPPAGLDFSVPTGESVSLAVGSDQVRLLDLPDAAGEVSASSQVIGAPGGVLQVQLGYRPLLIEEVAAGSCTPTATSHCLNNGRFRVEVAWSDYQGRTGSAQAVPLTTDSGLFWFFEAANIEFLVKVIDGCSYNDRFWVYAAGTTDVEYWLTVTDTANGTPKTYHNPLGTASPAITDSSAFDTCP